MFSSLLPKQTLHRVRIRTRRPSKPSTALYLFIGRTCQRYCIAIVGRKAPKKINGRRNVWPCGYLPEANGAMPPLWTAGRPAVRPVTKIPKKKPPIVELKTTQPATIRRGLREFGYQHEFEFQHAWTGSSLEVQRSYVRSMNDYF